MQRFKHLKTFNDIKLEKARLKYEMLVAENNLKERYSSFSQIFTFQNFFGSFTSAFHYAQNIFFTVFKYVKKFINWRSRRKEKKEEKRQRKQAKQEQ